MPAMSAVADLLVELVRFPTHQGNAQRGPGDERALCEHLAPMLRARGADDVIVESSPRTDGSPGAFVFARWGTPRRVINAHVDTVPANTGWSREPWDAHIAGGKLFETVFGIPYIYAMLLGAFVVVFYTLIGGFLAVCWTDFIQGVMMFFAILIVPMAAIYSIGGVSTTFTALYTIDPQYFNPFTKADGSMLSFVELISLLGWGLGYFGQPHILVRFMAITSSAEIKQATRIAMTWVVLSLAAAVLVGMVGRVYLTTALTGSNSETVFLVMTNLLFSPFAAGLVLSAVLAAIMSTASSQLLVAASAFAQDFYKALFRKHCGQKELLWVSRVSVLVITAISIFIGLNPDNFILEIVAYAWAGFGAAFGPALLASLFWRRATRNGILAGIITGGLTVLIWKQFAFFGLYEIVPGFFFSLLAIYIVSKLDHEPPAAVTEMFDTVEHSKI